jgi:GNAT superfamily N-acetyltransferase
VNAGKGVDDKAYVVWVMEQVFGRRRERVTGPCALLDLCFCTPVHNRRGAGKKLVEWGTKRADELGLKSFVEASFPGRRLYEGCRFEVKEAVSLDKGYGKVEYLWMEREPRPLPN